MSHFGRGELKDWVSTPPTLGIPLGYFTMMDFYTQLYFFLCLFMQRSALLPVKTGEDVLTSTNARVLLGGRGLVARQVRAHELDAHLSCVSSHRRKPMVLLPVLTASIL